MTPENHDENNDESTKYTLVEEDVKADLDPELQEVVISQRQNRPTDSHFTRIRGDDDDLVVDVIGKLHNPTEEVPGLVVEDRVGQIVTGTVHAKDIESVRSHKNVISLKAAGKLRPALHRSVRDMEATAQQLQARLPASLSHVNGKGVVVGIIDNGCDFAHPNFLSGGKTRIKFLWDQKNDPSTLASPGLLYGREFTSKDIDNALGSATTEEAYQRLRYDPGTTAHGTHVMDIAAGSGSAQNPPGVAPGADIIFVDLSLERLEDFETLGNSKNLLQAIKYIFNRAGKQPAVVNISLNSDCGPHDGSSPAEQWIDGLLSQSTGKAVVIAAGNSRLENHHVSRELQPGQPTSLLLELPKADTTDNKLDIWYSGAEELEIFLFSPRGDKLGPFPLQKVITIKQGGKSVVRVHHRKDEPNNRDNQVVVRFFVRDVEAGTWRVTLRPLGIRPVIINAWIEADPGLNATFKDVLPTDTACTIGSLACGKLAIAVSSYDPDAPANLAARTCEGPTRDGRKKPEVSAPGVRITAADSRTISTRQASGTSAAAPHVAGLIALLMQAAGEPLSAERIRDAVINNARKNPPPPGAGWHPYFGMGRVSAVSAILSEVNPAPPFETVALSSAAAASDGVNPSPSPTGEFEDTSGQGGRTPSRHSTCNFQS